MSQDAIDTSRLLAKKFEDRNKVPPLDKSEVIVFALMDNILNRRGFHQVWNECNEKTREEILSELYERAKRIIGK